jgi:hypothetical protein
MYRAMEDPFVNEIETDAESIAASIHAIHEFFA